MCSIHLLSLWDTPENIARAKQKVDAVLNGCRCRTGCHTRRCSCRKHNNCCGPGCRCIGCNNVTSTREQTENEGEGDDEIEMKDLMETLPDESTDDSESEIEVTEEDQFLVKTVMMKLAIEHMCVLVIIVLDVVVFRLNL